MSLIDVAQQTLTNLATTEVIKERLSLALDFAKQLEARIAILDRENGKLEAKLERALEERQASESELQELKSSLHEDLRILEATEWRRGLRTGGEWLAFCPICHAPAKADLPSDPLYCSSPKCGWQSVFNRAEIDSVRARLD